MKSLIFIPIFAITFGCSTTNKTKSVSFPSRYSANLFDALFPQKISSRQLAEAVSAGDEPLVEDKSANMDTSLDGVWVVHDLICASGSQVKDEDKKILENPEFFAQFVFSGDELSIRARAPKSRGQPDIMCTFEGRSQVLIKENSITMVKDLGQYRECPNEEKKKEKNSSSPETINMKIRENKGVTELLLAEEKRAPFCTNKGAGSIVLRKFIGG
ncbi:hypothetical protein K2X05_01855 [bacterium]|nr:hypothetical protein [bacterium]